MRRRCVPPHAICLPYDECPGIPPKQLDGSKGQLNVELVHNNPKATVYWHLDNSYLSETQDFHKISFLPASGKHSLTAVDNEGNTVSVTFFVE